MTLEELEKKLFELDDLRMELNKQIAELKERGEEKPEPPHPRPYPKDDQIYYYVMDMGEVDEMKWTSDRFDLGARKIGNVFVTESAAIFAAERLKVLAEMREWAGEWNAPYLLLCGVAYGNVYVHWTTNANGAIKFQTEEDAKNCIKAVGEERLKKYYFMIPEDENNE